MLALMPKTENASVFNYKYCSMTKVKLSDEHIDVFLINTSLQVQTIFIKF